MLNVWRVEGNRFVTTRYGYRFRSILLVAGLAAVGLFAGWAVAGWPGALLSAAFALAAPLLSPRIGTRWLMRMQGARPLAAWQVPSLHTTVERLARRAGLARAPALYLLPGAAPQALAAGEGRDTAIGVTASLLQRLPPAEVAAVVAHELSHLRAGDVRLTRFAASVGALTRGIAVAGWVAVLMSLTGLVPFPGSVALFVITAPTLATLGLSALSRIRELHADVAAAALLGEPEPLARALLRIESLTRPPWPLAALEPPAWLRTHPPTALRVERLLALRGPRSPAAGRPAPPGATRPEPVVGGGRIRLVAHLPWPAH